MRHALRRRATLKATLAAAGLLARPGLLRASVPAFAPAFTFGTRGSGPGQFEYVEDFAFTRDGHLLVTDAAHAWVQVFEAGTGRFLTRFGGKGDGEENLDKPEGIAVDPAGNIYVADYNTGLIQAYDPAFRWTTTFGGYGSAPGQLLKPEFMAVHDGRLYVPEAGNHRVSVFALNGTFLFRFGGPGTEPGRMNNPEAIKPGPDGQLYLTDLRNDRVQVFDAEGVPLRAWGSTGTAPGQLRSPAGIAVDAAGRIYVTEIGNDRVQVFDAMGVPLGAWGQKGGGPGEFANLHGIAVDSRSGLVFVADTGNHRVQVFRPAGG